VACEALTQETRTSIRPQRRKPRPAEGGSDLRREKGSTPQKKKGLQTPGKEKGEGAEKRGGTEVNTSQDHRKNATIQGQDHLYSQVVGRRQTARKQAVVVSKEEVRQHNKGGLEKLYYRPDRLRELRKSKKGRQEVERGGGGGNCKMKAKEPFNQSTFLPRKNTATGRKSLATNCTQARFVERITVKKFPTREKGKMATRGGATKTVQ